MGDGEKIKQDEPDSPLKKDDNSVWEGTETNIFGARNGVLAFQFVIETGSSGASGVDVFVTDPSTGLRRAQSSCSGHRLVNGTDRIANDFTLPGADQEAEGGLKLG